MMNSANSAAQQLEIASLVRGRWPQDSAACGPTAAHES